MTGELLGVRSLAVAVRCKALSAQSRARQQADHPRGWRRLLVTAALVLAGCVSPGDSGVQVIVGAKLDPGAGRPPVDYSVVVIADGKFQAVGPQSSTPVPIGAKMTKGLGMTIEPIDSTDPIETGRPANLVLKGDHDRVMRAGNWVQ